MAQWPHQRGAGDGARPGQRGDVRGRMEAAIARALQKADQEGIRGKATTPFLLRQVAEESGGESIVANLALLEQNAGVAARIAIALA